MKLRWVVIVVLALVAAAAIQFWPTGDADVELPARAVPMAQSAAARALRLPRMRPAMSRAATPSDQPVVVEVQVLIQGASPRDTAIQARAVNAACDEVFTDTAVVRTGDAVQDAVVWVEGPATALTTGAVAEHRPTVRLETCRLLPRVQVAAPGSLLQLVMRDSLSESLVVVPSVAALPVDTVNFMMDGQLVPVRHLADSTGVLAVYATRLPWARAFVAIAPVGAGAVTTAEGRARFTLDARGGKATIRAWHPSLGVVGAKVSLKAGGAAQVVTLTFRR